jgi:hypothetical protein
VVATVFLTDFTIHGPVRVAVAVGPDGAVRGARVVEVTEETYVWIKPLIDANFMQRLAGAPASPGARDAAPGGDPMSEFYAGVIAGLVQRAAALFDVAVRQAGGA